MSGYPRPEQREQHVERVPVEGRCTACGEARLARYPVLSEGGWFDVVKCQACLISAQRERAGRLGPIELLVDAL
jgi:vanillate/4-hydroxybenzoate decarboxylase subunit D